MYLQHFFKQHPYSVCLVLLSVVVAAGFFLRINTFDVTGSSYFHVDVLRDYLIADHILTYGELPLVGPDGYFGPNTNSPVYYYIVAGLLAIENHVLFPGLVNVFLQTLCIVIVFLIGQRLFGNSTGIAAAALFAFSGGIVLQSVQMWQPHLMQVFLLLSLLLLLRAHQERDMKNLYGSVALFTGAGVLHSSVFALGVPYLFILLLLLRQWRAPFYQYLIALCIGVGVMLAAFASVIYHFFAYTVAPQVTSHTKEVFDLAGFELIVQVGERFMRLVSHILNTHGVLGDAYAYLCAFLLLAGSFVYLFFEQDAQRKRYLCILWTAVAGVTVCVGLMALPKESGFPVRYFTPVFGIFCVLLAELIVRPFHHVQWVFAVKVALLCGLVFISAHGMGAHLSVFPSRLAANGLGTFYQAEYAWKPDVIALAQIIERRIGESASFVFEIKTYHQNHEDSYMNELVWVPLEQVLGRQLVTLNTTSLRGYVPIGVHEHLFIRCVAIETPHCADMFTQTYSSQYALGGIVYTSPTVTYLYAQKR